MVKSNFSCSRKFQTVSLVPLNASVKVLSSLPISKTWDGPAMMVLPDCICSVVEKASDFVESEIMLIVWFGIDVYSVVAASDLTV